MVGGPEQVGAHKLDISFMCFAAHDGKSSDTK